MVQLLESQVVAPHGGLQQVLRPGHRLCHLHQRHHHVHRILPDAQGDDDDDDDDDGVEVVVVSMMMMMMVVVVMLMIMMTMVGW